MAQVVANFPSPLAPLTYNARTFTISDPGSSPHLYFVTIADPTLAGDLVGQTNLQAFCLDRSQQNGQPGYVYIGQIQVGGSAAKVYPGGWMPGSGYTPADPPAG